MTYLRSDFVKMINADIIKAEKCLNDPDSDIACLHVELDGKYQSCFDDWGKGMYGYSHTCGFNPDLLDTSRDSLCHNIRQMIGKMKALEANRNTFASGANYGVQFSSNISSNIDLAVNTNFKAAKQQIENMSALPSDEINEILSKLDELEKIVSTKESKLKKWDKTKSIIKWVADKGFDVAITFLPLILNIN